MPPLTVRDATIAVFFGVAAVWLWSASTGLLSAYVQLPLLSVLYTKIGGDQKVLTFIYMLVSEIPIAAICALVIVGPLAWFVRSHPPYIWCLFGGAFFVTLVIVSPLWLSLALNTTSPWVLLYWVGPCMFLFWALAFLYAGRALRGRNAVA